ncbi:hypothetical protein AgCh_002044 [Apium graveolens]
MSEKGDAKNHRHVKDVTAEGISTEAEACSSFRRNLGVTFGAVCGKCENHKRDIETMTNVIHEHSPPPGFTPPDKGQPSTLVDADGVITLTPEEEVLLLKIRAEKLAAEKGKTKEDQAKKEAEARAKRIEADAL